MDLAAEALSGRNPEAGEKAGLIGSRRREPGAVTPDDHEAYPAVRGATGRRQHGLAPLIEDVEQPFARRERGDRSERHQPDVHAVISAAAARFGSTGSSPSSGTSRRTYWWGRGRAPPARRGSPRPAARSRAAAHRAPRAPVRSPAAPTP